MNRLTPDSMASDIAQQISEKLPAQSIERRTNADHELLSLPMGECSDYDFEVYCYGGGEASLCAKPRDAEPKDRELTFWYVPFESYRGDEGANAVFDYLMECLLKAISFPTRITHRKGWLFGSFVLESKIDGRWDRIYRYGYLRLGVRVPKVEGRVKLYNAEPPKDSGE